MIKVEDTGDRRLHALVAAATTRAGRPGRARTFLALNRGKRSIRINLKSEPGKEVLLRLARDADVLLESFRPGVMDRLGVGYERLREREPAAWSTARSPATARTAPTATAPATT